MVLTSGKHIQRQAAYVQKYLTRRAREKDFFGYEHMDVVTGLGKVALSAVGAWTGSSDGESRTLNGEPLVLDADHPLTQVSLQSGVAMRALRGLTTAMDGGSDDFSFQKQECIQNGRDGIAYTLGHRLLNRLSQLNQE